MDAEEFFRALFYVNKAIEDDPDMLDNYFLLADIYSDMGLYSQSNNIYYRLLAADEELTDCYFRIAQNYIYLGDTDTAVWYLKRSIAFSFDEEELEDASEVLNLIGGDATEVSKRKLRLITPDSIHERTLESSREALAGGDYQGALDLLSKIPQESEHYNEALNNIAFGYACMNRHDLSLDVSRKAIASEPDNIYTLCNMISSYSNLKDGEGLEKACGALGSVKAQDPADHFKVAVAYLECGDIEAAVKHLNIFLDNFPYNEAAILLLGFAYHNQGEIMKAKECMVELINLDPANTVAKYYNLLMSQEGYVPQKLEYIRQVPPAETMDRLQRLSGFASLKGAVAAQAVNDNIGDIVGLIKWCFMLPDFELHDNLIAKLAECRTAAAEGFLQSCLVDTNLSDAIKRRIIPKLIQDKTARNVSIVVGDKFRSFSYRLTKAVSESSPYFVQGYSEVFAVMAMFAEGFENDLLKAARKIVSKLKGQLESMHSASALSAVIAYEFGRIKSFGDIATVCALFGASESTVKSYLKRLNSKDGGADKDNSEG